MGKRKQFSKGPAVPYMNLTTPNGEGEVMNVTGGIRLDKSGNAMYEAWVKDAKKRIAKGKAPREYTFTGTIWLPEMGSANSYSIPE